MLVAYFVLITVLLSNCYGTTGPPIKCGINEIYVTCKTQCPPQFCNISYTDFICPTYVNCVPGCDCIKDHLRNSNGVCVFNEDCPPPPPPCGENEIQTNCKITCPPQNCNYDPMKEPCKPGPCQPGCICVENYLRNSDGKCILKDECPPEYDSCNRDRNVLLLSFTECPKPCPSACRFPNELSCKKLCKPYGCQCKPSYIRLKPNGPCISENDCPGGYPCPKNETFVSCKFECPNDYCPMDDSLAILICDPAFPCPSGCVCKQNYKRKSPKDPGCILASECSPVKCTRPNEKWNSCPSQCLIENCSDRNRKTDVCETFAPDCRPRCVCQSGFYRNDTGICVPATQCPPICGENEVATDCKRTCPPEYCDFDPTKEACKPGPCQPGCNCIDDYLRNENGTCIPKAQCPKPPSECDVPKECRPTCAQPNPPNCETYNTTENVNGCKCKSGYILKDDNGECVRVRDCPRNLGCNGDANAVVKECPAPCPSTCQAPNKIQCRKACLPIGCECKPGYIRSKVDGNCVLLDYCPGGYPCPRNETFVSCKVGCPTNYCPVEVSRGILICDPPYPCPSGCVCKRNYKRRSRQDTSCILASDCPPICDVPKKCRPTCAVPNPPGCDTNYNITENVNGCKCKPGFILKDDNGECVKVENCPRNLGCNGDANAVVKKCPAPCPSTCQAPNEIQCKKACLPVGCECKPGYIRSKVDGNCILLDHCPGGYPCPRNETFVSCKVGCPTNYCPVEVSRGILICDPPYPCPSGCVCKSNYKRISRQDTSCILASDCPPICDVPKKCRPTCAVPNPPGCDTNYNITENVNGCKCKPGFILTDDNGECIKVENCPRNLGCNGDANAVVKECPAPCPSTCQAPNEIQCRKACLPVGCECKPGYIRSKVDGNCVLLDHCPGGYPCPRNETFVSCKVGCPTNYCPVEVSRGILICDPPYPCPSGCVCTSNYKRISRQDTSCILASDCPPICDVPKECRPTCAAPNPPDCDTNYNITENVNGCKCKPGFILKDDNGECVKVENCPPNLGCNGDDNAVVKQCPAPCPSTCQAPNEVQCYKACLPVGCECKPGYIRSTVNGNCVLLDQCPGGYPCPRNETFETCKIGCSTNYCPAGQPLGICAPPYPCPSGCVCKQNYKRISRQDTRCILASDCPRICDIPKKCRPTCAVPNPPDCDTYYNITENVSGCKCKPGFILKDDNGECVSIENCPQNLGCNGDSNAVVRECPIPCPSTCSAPNATPCKKACQLGCECNPGYIYSETKGQCVLPDNCPGGNPCNKNETFVTCSTRCPFNYCPKDDSQTEIDCVVFSCLPGCHCKLNYRRESVYDERCILSSECPPVNCTRPNEIWASCPSDCLRENCEDAGKDNGVCNTLLLNCNPRCICKPNTYRNERGICVPVKKCPKKLKPAPDYGY